MVDREKVMRGIEWCIQHGSMGGHDCYGHFEYNKNSNACIGRVGDYRKDCPYKDCETGCAVTLARDALDMLKEQDEMQDALDVANEMNTALYNALPTWIPVTEGLPETRQYWNHSKSFF